MRKFLQLSLTPPCRIFNANPELNIEMFGQTMGSYGSIMKGSVLLSIPFPWIPNLWFDAEAACISGSCQLRLKNFTCKVRTDFLPRASLHIRLHWIPSAALWHSQSCEILPKLCTAAPFLSYPEQFSLISWVFHLLLTCFPRPFTVLLNDNVQHYPSRGPCRFVSITTL